MELLRAKQFQVALSGDKTMLVWLDKQYLDQHDKNDIDHTTKGKPMDFTFNIVHTLKDKNLNFSIENNT